jgi:hypothetical protein
MFIALTDAEIAEERKTLVLWWMSWRGFRPKRPGDDFYDRRFRNQLAILNFWRKH